MKQPLPTIIQFIAANEKLVILPQHLTGEEDRNTSERTSQCDQQMLDLGIEQLCSFDFLLRV